MIQSLKKELARHAYCFRSQIQRCPGRRHMLDRRPQPGLLGVRRALTGPQRLRRLHRRLIAGVLLQYRHGADQ